MSSARRLHEETGLIESNMLEKQSFLDHSLAEAAGGRITGCSLGHVGSAKSTPDVSNASTGRGYHLSSKQNHCVLILGIV
jgi:hypothetical protein